MPSLLPVIDLRMRPLVGFDDASGEDVIVPRLYPDSTIVCLGSGPSLTEGDVTACRHLPTIAVNDTHRLAPWAIALMASDYGWWKHYEGVPEFQGRKYCLDPVAHRRSRKRADLNRWGVEPLNFTGREGVDMNPSCLRSGSNSGAAAVNLAVHFGAKQIVLLGYDMGAHGGKTHWFGDHPQTLQRDSPYVHFREMFATQVEPLRELGISVINCSRETALTCFECRPLERYWRSQ